MCKNKTLQLRSICITYTKVENYNSAQKSCVFFNITQAHYLLYWLNHQKLQAAMHTFIMKVSAVSAVGCYGYHVI